MKKDNTPLEYAYDFCQQIVSNHYENFPVASFLVPRRLRRPIAAIYAFARTADDIADEGDSTVSERLKQLEHYQIHLNEIVNQQYQGNDPVFIALADTVNEYQLPVNLLSDLLTAFKQDINKQSYEDWASVLNYCHYSANPVGRLLLHLDKSGSENSYKQSDAICTALQLINFFQDIKQDFNENNRIYLPQNITDRAHLEHSIASNNSALVASSLRDYYLTTLNLFKVGYPLGLTLSGRLAWEIRSITLAGLYILKKLSLQSNQDLFNRPRISKQQLFHQASLALAKPMFQYQCKMQFEHITKLNAQNKN